MNAKNLRGKLSKPEMHCRIATLLATLCVLTVAQSACTRSLYVAAPNLNIYQSPILKIKANSQIECVDGSIYTPQTDEIWYSESKFSELEQKYITLLGK